VLAQRFFVSTVYYGTTCPTPPIGDLSSTGLLQLMTVASDCTETFCTVSDFNGVAQATATRCSAVIPGSTPQSFVTPKNYIGFTAFSVNTCTQGFETGGIVVQQGICTSYNGESFLTAFGTGTPAVDYRHFFNTTDCSGAPDEFQVIHPGQCSSAEC
jgi:hypothetical protein